MRKKCQLCHEDLANWERELHDEWHRVHDVKESLGFWKTIGWGILFASPFWIACIIVWIQR